MLTSEGRITVCLDNFPRNGNLPVLPACIRRAGFYVVADGKAGVTKEQAERAEAALPTVVSTTALNAAMDVSPTGGTLVAEEQTTDFSTSVSINPAKTVPLHNGNLPFTRHVSGEPVFMQSGCGRRADGTILQHIGSGVACIFTERGVYFTLVEFHFFFRLYFNNRARLFFWTTVVNCSSSPISSSIFSFGGSGSLCL